jgi:trigger factor
LLEELVKHVEIDLPETLVRREADYMLTQTAMQLSQQGIDIKQMFTRDVIESLRERSRPEAVTRIKRTMALGEVAKRESIKVEPEAIDAKVEEMMAEYAGEDIDRDRLRQVVEEDLLKEKILGWLEEHGTVELVPEGSLEPEADAASADEPDPETIAMPDAASADEGDVETIDVEVIPESTEAPAEASDAAESGEA